MATAQTDYLAPLDNYGTGDIQALIQQDPAAAQQLHQIFSQFHQEYSQGQQQAAPGSNPTQVEAVTSTSQQASVAGIASSSQTPTTSHRSMYRSTQPPATADGIFVEITEQPKQRGLRFRYECEGRSAGSIPGERTTAEKKTYPTIKIHNYSGTAVVVVSCVCKDSPYDPHPHNLVGRDCKKGVCTIKVKDANTISFPHLGIQCAKKKDVEANLKQRKEINVDPFQSGFKHLSKASNLDLNVVRLCFQVFLPDASGKISRIVPPVVSQPINDKKALNDLIICRIDRTSGKARGGEEVFLLCEKINRGDDIQVRFVKKDAHGNTIWEDFGDFSINDIHRQYAIVFKTPAYKDAYITQPVEVDIQLKRTSDSETSDPVPFTYMPEDPDPDRIIEKKKRKIDFLKTYGIDGNNANENDVKARLKSKAIRSKMIKQENEADVPMYSLNNITGNSPIPAVSLSAGATAVCTPSVDNFGSPSMNVISTDNGAVGHMTTITATESVQQQLRSLPPRQQFEILRQLAMRKLQQECVDRKQMTTNQIDSSQVLMDTFQTQNLVQMMNSESGVLFQDVSMQQGVPNLPSNGQEMTSSIEANLQAILTEQTASLDSIEGLSGELLQIAAEENVVSEEREETAQAIRGLNLS